MCFFGEWVRGGGGCKFLFEIDLTKLGWRNIFICFWNDKYKKVIILCFLGLVSEGENSKKGVSSFLKDLQGKQIYNTLYR